MKQKIIVLLCIVSACVCVQSQDIIVLLTGEELQVKVTKVGLNEIEYKKWTNQDGPVYTANTKEVFMIKYQNGEKDVFATNAASFVEANEPENEESENMNIANDLPYIYRMGNTYQCEDIKLKGKAYEEYLYNNCTAAYMQYKSGKTVADYGWGLLVTGLIIDLVSTIGIFTSGSSYYLIPSYVGGALEIACIPTLIVGYTRMHRSADTYNTSCANKKQAYWSFGKQQLGTGLALHF